MRLTTEERAALVKELAEKRKAAARRRAVVTKIMERRARLSTRLTIHILKAIDLLRDADPRAWNGVVKALSKDYPLPVRKKGSKRAKAKAPDASSPGPAGPTPDH